MTRKINIRKTRLSKVMGLSRVYVRLCRVGWGYRLPPKRHETIFEKKKAKMSGEKDQRRKKGKG